MQSLVIAINHSITASIALSFKACVVSVGHYQRNSETRVTAMSVNQLTQEFEYADECLQHLLDTEHKRPDFHLKSPQLDARPDLMQRIQVLCLCLKLSTRVKYLSIYIMDFFMDNHVICEDKLELVLMCSLSIAVKVEECDRTVKYSQMFSETNQYSSEEVLEMEELIINHFEWQFLTPTPATYIDYFCAKCLPEIDSKKLNKSLIEKYMDKSIDLRFYAFRPSVIAASTIYYTREKHHLTPVWPKNAQNITKYSLTDLKDCIHELKKYDFLTTPSKRFINIGKQLNDSGFVDYDNKTIIS